jgi:hypothetical protein
LRTLLIAPSAAEPSLPIVRARSRAEAEGYLESIPMEPRERVLYHQIHPLKLGGDIGADLVSLPLIWGGRRRWSPPDGPSVRAACCRVSGIAYLEPALTLRKRGDYPWRALCC